MSTNLDILPLNNWIETDGFPLVICGPCSAENRDDLIKVAKDIALIPHVKIFRAGIWKPRTRPDGFEGVGNIGLQWLKEIKSQTNLLTTVEVANPSHIEQCLANDVDVLWIGARTVGNPFSMQEIAETLKGVDIPVMIKNPLNADLKLWIGAFERMNMAGIKKLVAVHRGFYAYDAKPYRNAPMWEIPIELKRIVPNLPVICDPSHIAGNRELLSLISQKALDLEMEGLMIEVHPDPDKALTDANQQITPDVFAALIECLIIRKEKGNREFESKLEELRAVIDGIDDELVRILKKRMQVVSEIGKYKKANNVTILQLRRWNDIINDRMKKADKMGLNKDFLESILMLIHDESIQIQTDIFNKEE